MILLEPCLGAWPHLLEPIARNAVGIQVNKVICDIDVGGGGGLSGDVVRRPIFCWRRQALHIRAMNFCSRTGKLNTMAGELGAGEGSCSAVNDTRCRLGVSDVTHYSRSYAV